MSLKNKGNFLTSAEAAELVGVTPDYIRRLIMDKKLKATRLGRNWLVKRHHVQKITRQRFPKTKEKVDNERVT
jgi:excisionase family DNA binding protein